MDWILQVGFVIVAIGLLAYAIAIYNSLVRLLHGTDRAWADIDVLLTQRHEELPKLVATVRGFMAHEREVLEAVTEARQRFGGARSIADKAEADSAIHAALERLIAVAESYPEVKADSTCRQLMDRVSTIEDSIADRREFYNHAVNLWNVRIDQFPDLIVAAMLGMRQARDLFVALARARDDVEISLEN